MCPIVSSGLPGSIANVHGLRQSNGLDLARNPPLNSKNALFARVGIEKVFALRAQGGGRVGYLEPKLHRVATLVSG